MVTALCHIKCISYYSGKQKTENMILNNSENIVLITVYEGHRRGLYNCPSAERVMQYFWAYITWQWHISLQWPENKYQESGVYTGQYFGNA